MLVCRMVSYAISRGFDSHLRNFFNGTMADKCTDLVNRNMWVKAPLVPPCGISLMVEFLASNQRVSVRSRDAAPIYVQNDSGLV